MSGIVCAIRGGTASRPTINRAIKTARETGLPLYFLYVLNLDFLMRTSHAKTHTIAEELRELGEFIVLAAQTEAEGFGVQAQGVIREGHVISDQIVALCHEIEADYIILGQPQKVKEKNVFTGEAISQLGQRLEQETGAQVVFSTGEDL